MRQKRKVDLNRSRLPLFRQGGATVGLTTRLSAKRDQGGFITYREVCGSDKGNVNQVEYLEYPLVEMTFVVGQGGDKSSGRVEGMVGFRRGGDKSQIDAAGLEHQDGTKVMLCFLRSEMIQQEAFEIVVLFSRPKRLLHPALAGRFFTTEPPGTPVFTLTVPNLLLI